MTNYLLKVYCTMQCLSLPSVRDMFLFVVCAKAT